ncbi:MAG: fumarate hydratase C-terminal domain-containing protein [Christensenellales bacterium]|jgi:L(+)-tartrate dehydratase beta subunit
MATYHLRAPLTDADVLQLKLGDIVFLSGPAFTCRSRLHRYVLEEGHPMPASTLDKNLLIHVGPIVVKDEDRWRLVSFMPTSSIRFEKWGAQSIEKWGLKLIVGKTTMGPETAMKMKERKCVHVTPIGVTPNLWIDSIKILGVDYFEELGTIEATWDLELNELGPFVVDMDCEGKNLFDAMDEVIEARRLEAYDALGIPRDFEFTKLY